MIDIHDYLIDQAGLDWTDLLSGWVPPLPTDFIVWMVNRFGDVLVVFEDETVHILDVGAGSLTQLAANRDDLTEKVAEGENADFWFLITLTNKCLAAGMELAPGQCYGFKIPPVLGGLYELDNIEPTDLSVHYAFLADIHAQTKDLPDGAKISIKVVP